MIKYQYKEASLDWNSVSKPKNLMVEGSDQILKLPGAVSRTEPGSNFTIIDSVQFILAFFRCATIGGI
jgi:hypothetical protein